MRNKTRWTSHIEKDTKVFALVLASLFLASIIGGSGIISVESPQTLTFMEVFGESPLDRVRIKANYTRIAYSNKMVTFLERFDDPDMKDPNEYWTYSETGSNTSTAMPWVGASNILFVTMADGTNYTHVQYSTPASKKTGLKPDSDGTIITARCGEVHGTPEGGLQLSSSAGNYVRVFFDGSGNIDIGYHAATTGTLTTVDNYVASATANKWYSFQIDLHSSTALVKVFNETGVQLGSTETLSTYLTYSSFSNMTIWANTTVAATKILGFDWIYATKRKSNTDYSETEILPNTKDSAPDDKEIKKTEFSYETANIENDSSTSKARAVFNLTESEPGDFDSQTSFNASEFRDYISTISEGEFDVKTKQTYYAKGWRDLGGDLEDALTTRLEQKTHSSVTVVDYVILDINLSVVFSDYYTTMIEDWFKDDGIDIILEQDPDCTVTLKNGDIVSAATMPREAFGAFLTEKYYPGMAGACPWYNPACNLPSDIDELKFSAAEKAQDAVDKLTKEFRDGVSNAGGIIDDTVSGAIDSTTNVIQQTTGKVQDLVDNFVVAPMNAMMASISSGISQISAQISSVANSLRSAISGSLSSIANSVRGLATSISTTISDAIGSTFEGISSAFASAGKAIKDKALSFFSFITGFTGMLKTYLFWGALVLIVIVVVFIAWRKGLFEKAINKAQDVGE